nr:MAG TPA: hypothetical protein [Caudoviricetes sp.]
MGIDGDLLSRRLCRQFPKRSLPAEGLTKCKALIFLYGGVNRFIFVLLCDKMGLMYPLRFLCLSTSAPRWVFSFIWV